MIFADGSIAVAVVKNRVMVVQATRTHTKREKYLDVHTYAPFGAGVFLASDVPSARIAASDVLAVLPPVATRLCEPGMLELPQPEYAQYVAHSARHQKRQESLWNAWVSRNCN